MDDKSFSILYVDDEPQNLGSFRAVFRRDYNVLTAESAEEGMKILRSNEVHLIITDQRMPGMTGIQFLERVIPEFPDAIRMVLTGFSDIEAIISAINSGQVFRYITKPWDEQELRMTIENAKQIFLLQNRNRNLVTDLQNKVSEQERILRLFTRYVPKPVVDSALSASEEGLLEGDLVRVAVLFCDIRGFTPMSERLSPKEVVDFLNTYYSVMTRIVKRYNGAVNQFVGDEVFAAFGAPVAHPNNEANAVFCALEMMHQGLPELTKRYLDRVGQPIRMGIGIHGGEVVAGNLGSEDRIDYSLTGDTVNTGKRIEMLTKEHPDAILVSNAIHQVTKDLVRSKPWEPLHVKGKKDKILVHEVLGRAE
jgi:adenylate cyclase